MKRNSTTLFLTSPGATTPVPWVNNAPDFNGFTEPTLSVLQNSWQEFLNSGQELEVVPDPEPVPEPTTPDWDSFNAYMLSDAMFKSYRDTVRVVDGELNSALFDAYSLVDTKGTGAFSVVWTQWCVVSQITVLHKEDIANVAEGFNLPADFVSVLRG